MLTLTFFFSKIVIAILAHNLMFSYCIWLRKIGYAYHKWLTIIIYIVKRLNTFFNEIVLQKVLQFCKSKQYSMTLIIIYKQYNGKERKTWILTMIQ